MLSAQAPGSASRRGAALAEFAIVVLLLYLLFASIVAFGQLFFSANVLQQAVDVSAQEFARTPLPATASFSEVLARTDVQTQLFDEKHLVLDLDTIASAGQSVTEFANTLPMLNRLLLPVYIADTRPGDPVGAAPRLLRYPGTLVRNSAGDLTVLIPLVSARAAGTGVESLTWVSVLEEVTENVSGTPTGSFSVLAGTTSPGVVSLRLNFPFQSATLSAFQVNTADPFEPNLDRVILADDGAVAAQPLPTGYSLVTGSGAGVGPYSGQFGLGSQFSTLPRAQGSTTVLVRPYRKVISTLASYRRELFLP